MANSTRPLLPLAHNQSRSTNELALSTANRKRDYSTSDSFIEPTSTDVDDGDLGIEYTRVNMHKRLQMLSSDPGNEYEDWPIPPSSPPRDEFSSFTSLDTSNLSFSTVVGTDRKGSLARTGSALTTHSSSFIVFDEKTACAVDIIRQALDEGKCNIELDSMGIREIPEEISDLRNMVSLVSGFNGNDTSPLWPSIRVFLSNNFISRIPPNLFLVDNITVLSLRNNQLASLPNSISRLRNLENLSVDGNQLTSLPSQILDLKRLHVLLLHPNPFHPLPPGKNISRLSQAPAAYCAYASAPKVSKVSVVPPLSELCLRILASYKATTKEIKNWKLPFHILNSVKHATVMNEYGNTCGNCKAFMVNETAYVLEWWNGVAGQSGVVIKRDFCSNSCIEAWKKSL
ncbi:hypothetical protein V1512DRAFT_230915 [Lipomyces arxii]|uniref:uncharacterized protein n=1 Tax=Lipomyces arxii TaxID=56418 RepID=UPI0034CDE1E7